MTGLHTRGYRPKPGERARTNWGFDTLYSSRREQWYLTWGFVRDRPAAMPSRVQALAMECLDAREQLDPLTERYAMRIARKAVAICGRLELLSTPEAANPWGPS